MYIILFQTLEQVNYKLEINVAYNIIINFKTNVEYYFKL